MRATLFLDTRCECEHAMPRTRFRAPAHVRRVYVASGMQNFCNTTSPPCAGYCTAGRCNGCPGDSPGEVSFGALHFCARTEPFAPVCAEKFTFASPCVARALCFSHTSGPCAQTSLATLRAQYESALLTKLPPPPPPPPRSHRHVQRYRLSHTLLPRRGAEADAFGVTPYMREVAAMRSGTAPAIFTWFLVHQRNVHGGNFGRRSDADLVPSVDALIERSPALRHLRPSFAPCTSVAPLLFVIHDTTFAAARRHGVRFLRFGPTAFSGLPSNARRWALLHEALAWVGRAVS